jgi:hypothetical protein
MKMAEKIAIITDDVLKAALSLCFPPEVFQTAC